MVQFTASSVTRLWNHLPLWRKPSTCPHPQIIHVAKYTKLSSIATTATTTTKNKLNEHTSNFNQTFVKQIQTWCRGLNLMHPQNNLSHLSLVFSYAYIYIQCMCVQVWLMWKKKVKLHGFMVTNLVIVFSPLMLSSFFFSAKSCSAFLSLSIFCIYQQAPASSYQLF